MCKKIVYLMLIPLFFWGCKDKNSFQLKEELSITLNELTNGLIKLKNNDETSENFGAIFCEHCNIYHTRAAESIFPFAVQYEISQEEKFLKSAVDLGNWLINQQQEDGSWKETPEEWTGTTTDQLLMMLLTYPIIQVHLDLEEEKTWHKSMKSAADYLMKVMSPEFASINYVATTTSTLALASKLLQFELYAKRAKELAHRVVSKMDEDGFIEGEGGRVLGNKYGVDLGYDMEMSLWGLGYYARLLNDKIVDSYVKHALKNHLYFIYPDGSLDNSWGIRSNKWTNYGSATSDGIQVLMALYKDIDQRYSNASRLNLEFLRQNINDGIIGTGSLYWEMSESPPCIYPTFAKAKNIALAYRLDDGKKTPIENIPTQNIGWMRAFSTLDIVQVRTEEIMSTISAYRYKDIKSVNKSKYMFRPGGGSITNLWIKGHGYLQAGSQTEYHRWEPMHFPKVDNLKSLTPRIEIKTNDGYFTNLFEFDGRITSKKINENEYSVTTTGELKNNKWEPLGIAYKLKHRFSDSEITKTIELRYHDHRGLVEIVEPIIEYPDMKFEKVDSNIVYIQAENKEFKFVLLKGDCLLIVGEDKEKYWSPYPSLKAFPIKLIVNSPENGFINTIEYKIEINSCK